MRETINGTTGANERFNEVAAAYLQSVERGRSPSRDELLAQFPDLAAELKAFFDDHDRLNRLAAPLRAAAQGCEALPAGPVLETLAGTIGSVPRVLLPDTQLDDRGVAVVRPSSPEMPPPGDRAGRYQLFGEIARGGMGAILKGRDTDLGRDLAVKVLLESHRGDPELVRRFVEEAQIGGQLQHPGIIPVYELGAFSDQRPYFTMKLVKGRTLAALLDERRRPSDDLPRLLGVFEQVCQTIAYAHARLVIHRDLKPSNIMVGNFGEVQVMDWGLAKVLKAGGVADEETVSPPPLEVSVIETVRSASPADESRAGSRLGTPAYMAPEQAEGDIAHVDRRADVFGLGSILCEILTGRPAYTGRTRAEVLRKAMLGDTADARARLDASGADSELVVLAQDCLAAAPFDRPNDAGVVSARVTAYLSGVQEKLRAAELARVEAQARAEEEVKQRALSDQLVVEAQARAVAEARRRKLTVGLAAASLVAIVSLVGIAAVYASRHRLRSLNDRLTETNARLEAALDGEQTARRSETEIRYFNDVLMAEREFAVNNVGRAERLLNACLPKAAEDDLRGWEWHYLMHQCHTELKSISVPETQAMGIAFSPDDRHLATTGYDDRAVRIYNADTGALEKTLEGLSGEFMSEGVAYSPDGTLVAASSEDVCVWDVATGRLVARFPCGDGNSSNVAFSPNGARVAAVSGEGRNVESDWRPTARVWEIHSQARPQKPVFEFQGNEGEMGWVGVAYSPDGRAVATASGKLDQGSTDNQPGQVTIWSLETGARIRALRHPGPLTCLAYSPDGHWIVTGGWDKLLHIWDVETERELGVLRGHTQAPYKVAFSRNGHRIASASEDGTARIWDATTFEELLTLRGHKLEVHAVAFNRNGSQVATLSRDRSIKIWDAVTGKGALALPVRRDGINAVAFSPDGQRIAAAGNDAVVKIYDAETGRELRALRDSDRSDPFWCVAFSRDGRIAAGSGHWNKPKTRGWTALWNVLTKKPDKPDHRLEAHARLVLGVAFSADGSLIATAGGEHVEEPGFVKVWDTQEGTEVATLAGQHTFGLLALAYSPDGRRIASAGWEGRVVIWDARHAVPIHTIKAHETYILALAISPDSRRIATAGWDGVVKIYEIDTGQEVSQFRGHKAGVWCVAFSPDSRRVASGGEDGAVKLWEPTPGEAQEALTLRGHGDAVRGIAFSPDGHRIASASKDGTVKIWDGTPEPAPNVHGGVP